MEMYGAVGLAAREGTIFLDHMEECLQIAQLPAFQRPAAIEAAGGSLWTPQKRAALGRGGCT